MWFAVIVLLLPAALAADAAGTPVILSTDIGDDIDDTWALALLLKCPEVDVKLVIGDYGRKDYRARLLARFLEVAGRTDIPVGVGLDIEPKGGKERQGDWVKDYDLKSYPGRCLRISYSHPGGGGFSPPLPCKPSL